MNSWKKYQNYCDKYYEVLSYGNDEFGSYTIYQCIDNCDNKFILNATKECVSTCIEDKPYELEKLCVWICLKDQIKPFSAIVGSSKKCEEKCSYLNNDPKYFGDDKICIENCGIFEHKKYLNEKENDFSCISHCDLKSENKFSYYDERKEKYNCLNNCDYLYDKDHNSYTQKQFYSTDGIYVIAKALFLCLRYTIIKGLRCNY